MKQLSIRKKRAVAVMASFALAAALAVAVTAVADVTISDGDGLTPIADHDMSFGNVDCGAATSKTALIDIKRDGAYDPGTQVFQKGTTATVTVLSTTGDLTASVPASPGNEISIPADWDTAANNTLTGDPVSATVTVTSSTPGPGSGTVTFRATGVNPDGRTIRRDDTMNVSWTTGDCTPRSPDLSIAKTADDAVVDSGQQIGFTITLSNSGNGAATNTTLTDDLPGGTGIDWSIESQSGPGTCSITGSPPSQSLGCGTFTLDAGAQKRVHVTSQTTAARCGSADATCGTFENTAKYTSDGGLSGSATASTTVDCSNVSIGGVSFGRLASDYLFFFANGSTDANWQSASKGFAGDVAVDGISAHERTSGTLPYAGTVRTNDSTLGAWKKIVDDNAGQASAAYNQAALIAGLEADLGSAFAQINAMPVTAGYESRSAQSLNGLNTQNGIAETYVINVTSGFQASTKIGIRGDEGDVFILRWDTDANSANGYQGQVKFQSGGAIVPLGGLTAGNFIHVAGDINASGGGSNPPAPYPQGPRLNDGTGALIAGGKDWAGGGFFTGYWLTTGDPSKGETASLSNAIFVGGWYSTTSKFSMTSGTSGVHVCPPAAALRK